MMQDRENSIQFVKKVLVDAVSIAGDFTATSWLSGKGAKKGIHLFFVNFGN